MDKELIKQRFSKASGTYGDASYVQQSIARKMTDIIRKVALRNFSQVLEIGCGTGTYSRLLCETFQPEQLCLNDISEAMLAHCTDIPCPHISFLQGDAETIAYPNQQDMITSCSVIQWFADPERFFQKCYAALNSRGILAFSTFGEKNYQEIKALTGSGLEYLSMESLVKMLPSGYQLLAAKEEIRQHQFPNPIQVLHHQKQTGVTGVVDNRQPWTQQKLQNFCDAYSCTFPSEDGVTLTYHPIYIVAIKEK